MKQYRFALARVLDYRRLQERLEQARLEQLHGEYASLTRRMQTLTKERDQAGRHLLQQGAATGAELALLDEFRRAASTELTGLENQRSSCQRAIDAQKAVLSERRRDVLLLEKLESRKRVAWNTQFALELEQQAAESHLARLVRHRHA